MIVLWSLTPLISMKFTFTHHFTELDHKKVSMKFTFKDHFMAFYGHLEIIKIEFSPQCPTMVGTAGRGRWREGEGMGLEGQGSEKEAEEMKFSRGFSQIMSGMYII